MGNKGLATQLQRISVTRLLFTLVLSTILTACGSGFLQPAVTPEPAPDMFSPLVRPADQYRVQADIATGDNAFAWQVLTIRSLLQQGSQQEAEARLQALRATASLPQQPVVQLLAAASRLTQNQPAETLSLLDNIDTGSLSSSGQAYWWLLKANGHEQQRQPVQAALALIARNELLSGPEQRRDIDRIYQLLSAQSPSVLRSAQSDNLSATANGWLRLLAILNSQDIPAEQKNWQLLSWERSYNDHPARVYLPQVQGQVQAPGFDASHIAVLLPLSGRLAEQGEAIRNGILSAGQGQSARVSFFDTQNQDMAALYQQIMQSGADMILGPLLKDNVDTLLKLDPALQVLALNQPVYQPELATFYYFSLAPEGEASDAARRMWEEGHQQPLIFAPDNELGRRVSAEFNRQWQTFSGQPAAVSYFSNQASIEKDVRRALGSHHADSVFMPTNAAETRFILPYFDFVRDSRATRLPTYVISRSYIPAGEAPMGELAGLRLADMPWMFDSAPQLKEEILGLWPSAGSAWLRLFALGYDARAIIPQLPALRRGAPGVPGLTGELTVSPEGVVQRHLLWREYDNGNWIPIGANAELQE